MSNILFSVIYKALLFSTIRRLRSCGIRCSKIIRNIWRRFNNLFCSYCVILWRRTWCCFERLCKGLYTWIYLHTESLIGYWRTDFLKFKLLIIQFLMNNCQIIVWILSFFSLLCLNVPDLSFLFKISQMFIFFIISIKPSWCSFFFNWFQILKLMLGHYWWSSFFWKYGAFFGN